MNEKERKKWLELYDIADKIKLLEPWRKLYASDILVYISQKYNIDFYCSVLGKEDTHTAIIIYEGEDIYDFFDYASNNYPSHMFLNYQNYFLCNYITREETLKENLNIAKEIGKKYRGVWTSFEYFKKGYMPSKLNIKQVDKLIEVLNAFYSMIKDIVEEKIKVDFEKGYTLVNLYDKEKHMYIKRIQDFILPQRMYDEVLVDKYIINDLKGVKRTENQIEYDFLNYLPLYIRDSVDSDGRRYYPLARILADKKSGMILIADMCDKKNYKSQKDYIYESLEKLIDYFIEYGIPKKMYVRDNQTKAIVKDLLNKMGIQIVVKPNLENIDNLENGFLRS